MTTSDVKHIVPPHGGSLVNLIVPEHRAAELKQQSRDWPSWDLTLRQMSDLELLLNGGFSPLTGYMTKGEYDAVVDSMVLPDGTLWPMPLFFDVSEAFGAKLKVGDTISLRDLEGVMLATLTLTEIFQPDLKADAKKIFGTNSPDHAGAAAFLSSTNPVFLAGTVEGIQPPSYFDFQSLRLAPADVRQEFGRLGWRAVVAFQTNRLIHRDDQEFTYKAALAAGANLFIHPTVDISRSHDKSYYSQIRSYKAVLPYYPLQTARLGLSPVQVRLAGPREALWHGLINRNFGCSHTIVDPFHTEPSPKRPFYKSGDYAALWKKFQDKHGVAMIRYEALRYVADKDEYMPADEIDKGLRVLSLNETELKERLDDGKEIPRWFTFPEVAREMARVHLPRHKQGFTVFFTGLSGAGKSTVANVLRARLMQMGQRPVTLLDGDMVRKNLSSELGFSKEHRDINIRRIGYVASEITKNGGIAICAPIAPYDAVRQQVKQMIKPLGGFILVYVSTPIDTCEARDRKGLYEKARAGIIKEFTGVSDPYEAPESPDVVLDTTGLSPAESAWEIVLHLEREGYVAAEPGEQD